MKFLEQIVTTSLYLDLILWSTVTMQVIIMELMVHWEENIKVAFERKLKKISGAGRTMLIQLMVDSMLSD